MVRAWLGRKAASVLIGAILVAGVPAGLRAQSAHDVAALNQQVVQLYGQGKYKQATAIAGKALALAERVPGPEHSSTLTSVNNLAELYRAPGLLRRGGFGSSAMVRALREW